MHDVSKKQSSQPLNDQAVLTRMTLSTTPGGGGSLGAGLVASGPSVLATLTCHGQHSADRHQQGDILPQSRLTITIRA